MLFYVDMLNNFLSRAVLIIILSWAYCMFVLTILRKIWRHFDNRLWLETYKSISEIAFWYGFEKNHKRRMRNRGTSKSCLSGLYLKWLTVKDDDSLIMKFLYSMRRYSQKSFWFGLREIVEEYDLKTAIALKCIICHIFIISWFSILQFI